MDVKRESTREYRVAKKRYRLLRPISKGIAATVWRARDTVTGKDVVVKQLERANVSDPVARRRLEDEAAAHQRVTHPGAVPVVDEMFSKTEAALVFPYIPGRSLAERLRDDEPISARDAARIALDVADVLAAAHSAGVVHRDVKPANILIARDGATHLVDFGIARSLDDSGQLLAGREEDALELTGSGMAVGTLPYMAPEQLTGAGPSPAADIYALGVVLYQMLAGERPYDGGSPTEQLALQQRPPALIDAPDALAALAYAALDPMPGRRPSATQLGRSLRAWLDGRPETEAATSAVPIVAGASGASGASGARHRGRLAIGLGAALVAILFVAFIALALGVGQPDAPSESLMAGAVPTIAPSSPATSPSPSTSPTNGTLATVANAPSSQAAPPKHGGHHHRHHHHHHKHHHGH